MNQESFLNKFKSEGGDAKALESLLPRPDPEFISGKKRIDINLSLGNEGEFQAIQNEDGVVNIVIRGPQGSVTLIDLLKSLAPDNQLSKLSIIAPPYALEKLHKMDSGKYEDLLYYAEAGSTAFTPIFSGYDNSDPVEAFILAMSPENLELWMLTLLHESGHALDSIDHNYFMVMPESEFPKEISRRERDSWAHAFKLVRMIKEKTGVNLLSIYNSKKDLQKIIYSAMLGHRLSMEEGVGSEDLSDLFDKGRLKRLE